MKRIVFLLSLIIIVIGCRGQIIHHNGAILGTNGDPLDSAKINGSNFEFYSGGTTYSTTASSGTVTSVAAGNGLDFTTITSTGSVTLGTPSTLTLSSTNAVTTTSHTHFLSIDNFGSGAAGLAPASGGGTTNFLRADGTWTAPTGGGTVTSVGAGNGMNFTTITGVGDVTLGTPTTLTLSTSNSASGTTHEHALSIADVSSGASGLAPAHGGVGATYYLNAAGTWTVPPGGGDPSWSLINLIPTATPSSTDEGDIYYDSDVDLFYGRNASAWVNLGAGGTVTSVAAGNGLDFTTITGSGSAVLGTPSELTLSTSNAVTTTSHTHSLNIANFTSSTAGLAPLSGGGTTNFLRADGTWAAPSGGGTVTSVAAGNGMDFTTITGSGSVTMGTPGSITSSSTNGVTATSHTHNFNVDTVALGSIAKLSMDTIPIASFQWGEPTAGDIIGAFYNDGTDTIFWMQMIAVLVGTSPSVAVDIEWHATFNSGSATHLNTTPPTITSTTVGDEDTSFNNPWTPPNRWIWCTISTVTTAPTAVYVTLLGYHRNMDW